MGSGRKVRYRIGIEGIAVRDGTECEARERFEVRAVYFEDPKLQAVHVNELARQEAIRLGFKSWRLKFVVEIKVLE